jgi:hypothetical protein
VLHSWKHCLHVVLLLLLSSSSRLRCRAAQTCTTHPAMRAVMQALSAAGEMFKVFNRDASERVKWLDKGQEHPHRVALQVTTGTWFAVLAHLAGALHTAAAL